MAKFAKGDKVVSVKTGAKGVVDEVYGEEKYAVLFDGATNPDRVEGFQIKAANGCVKNAKDGFGAEITVGDTVKFITGTWRGLEGTVLKIDGGKATVRTDEQGDVVDDLKLIRVYNSCAVRSANAVVQNAINARRARNAMVKIDDAEGAKRWDALWVKAAELKREAEALDKYLISKKQYGYSAKLESLAKALTGF